MVLQLVAYIASDHCLVINLVTLEFFFLVILMTLENYKLTAREKTTARGCG